ncbi:oxygenase MpaB family protein [Mesorhizobium sp. M0898]|uniref:oxygenase MpaB family protein n=2 Tax=unclassified Mesorhizobium TaxID=325217 RepID=UPI00333C1B8A
MFRNSGIISLPRPLERRVDTLAQSFMRQRLGSQMDFSTPEGEPALLPPNSVSWRIFKNPVAVFIGGVTAVLLELAEPRVRDAIWQHSSFRSLALRRLQRTGLAALVTVYGPRSKAKAMIEDVVRMHGRVSGRTSEGEPYHATDPELLDWVQATAEFGFMEAYHTYVHRLHFFERDAMFAEARPVALLYGAVGAPTSQAELYALFDVMRQRLVASPIVSEFLEIMEEVPALPGVARPLQRPLLKAAVEILPQWVRKRLELGDRWTLKPWERAVVKTTAAICDSTVLHSSPAVQSCRRLGLSESYLYRRTASENLHRTGQCSFLD